MSKSQAIVDAAYAYRARPTPAGREALAALLFPIALKIAQRQGRGRLSDYDAATPGGPAVEPDMVASDAVMRLLNALVSDRRCKPLVALRRLVLQKRIEHLEHAHRRQV